MRVHLTPEKMNELYPDYKEQPLIFGNCYLYVIGPNLGPFKIGKSTNLLSRFQSLYANNHLELFLFYASQMPIKIDFALEKKVHALLSDKKAKGEWFDVSLQQALEAIEKVNPLGRVIDFKKLSYDELLQRPSKHWTELNILPLQRERVIPYYSLMSDPLWKAPKK